MIIHKKPHQIYVKKFALLPHRCKECEAIFWLESYYRYENLWPLCIDCGRAKVIHIDEKMAEEIRRHPIVIDELWTKDNELANKLRKNRKI